MSHERLVTPADIEAEQAAHRAFAEFLNNGGVPRPLFRGGDAYSFVFEISGGGSREGCRKIIAEAKIRGGKFYDAFMRLAVAHASAPREMPK